jgi:hypothetical protein
LFECFSDIKSEAPFDRKREKREKIAKKIIFFLFFFVPLSLSVSSRECARRVAVRSFAASVVTRQTRARCEAGTHRASRQRRNDRLDFFFLICKKKTIFSPTLVFAFSHPSLLASLLHLVLLCGVPACAAEGHR